jgi:hypothetical protein
MNRQIENPRRCLNESCPRPAQPNDAFCEACSVEWSLFHREERAAQNAAQRRSGGRIDA